MYTVFSLDSLIKEAKLVVDDAGYFATSNFKMPDFA